VQPSSSWSLIKFLDSGRQVAPPQYGKVGRRSAPPGRLSSEAPNSRPDHSHRHAAFEATIRCCAAVSVRDVSCRRMWSSNFRTPPTVTP